MPKIAAIPTLHRPPPQTVSTVSTTPQLILAPGRFAAVLHRPTIDEPVTFTEAPGVGLVGIGWTIADAPLAPPAPGPAETPRTSAAVGAPVGELFAALVQRAAIGGDARRATIRMELGGRVVDRGQVIVHADGDEVEIEVAAPVGVDAARLASRVAARLASKGLRVTRFDVR